MVEIRYSSRWSELFGYYIPLTLGWSSMTTPSTSTFSSATTLYLLLPLEWNSRTVRRILFLPPRSGGNFLFTSFLKLDKARLYVIFITGLVNPIPVPVFVLDKKSTPTVLIRILSLISL